MKPITQWITALWGRLRKPTPKELITAIVCVLLFFTPTILAFLYVFQSNADLRKADEFSVILYTSDGTELARDSGTPDDTVSDSLLDIFYEINGLRTPLDSAPGNPESDTYIRAVMELNGVASELSCYFSFEEGKSYCLDRDQKAYAISDSISQKFLNSKYSESFYENSTPPELLTIDNETVMPSTVEWHYQTKKQSYSKAITPRSTSESLLYEMTGELGIRFETEPDFCLVRVYDDGTKLHEGSYHDLPYITVSSGNELSLQIRAVWNQEESKSAYGEITYNFRVLIRNRSEFSLNTDTVSAGGFAVLSCTNITDPQKIIFTSNVDGYSPVFHRDGDTLRALLPFSAEWTEQEFQFRIAYGASARSFSISILPASGTAPEYSYPELTLGEEAYAAATGQHEAELLQISSSIRNTSIYFRGNFLTPEDTGFSIGYTHGSKLFTASNPITPLTAFGTEYIANGEERIRVSVLNHGIVLHTGTDPLLGNFVVVDHGGGLRTWYGHLSAIDVEVGDVLQKGEAVGKAGKTGLATQNGFLFLCTVYQTVIEPDYIIGKEISLT